MQELLFYRAFATSAAERCDMLSDVFFAVVIGELFTCLNTLDSVNKNLSADNIRFTVRLTGMIDVASEVIALRTIDSLPRVHLKEVFALA